MSKVEYCPNCGSENPKGSQFCEKCGHRLQPEEQKKAEQTNTYTNEKSAIEHLTMGYSIAFNQPIVFLPSIISGLIGALVGYALNWVGLGAFLSITLGLASSILSFILNFASIDMSRDAYNNQPLDLNRSIEYVVGRFVEFLVAAIVGGILSITIILIPVVVFMFTIMVLEEKGFYDSFISSLEVIKTDIGDVLVILVISIVASIITGYIPYLSMLLDSVVNVIIGIAFIDVYSTYKQNNE